jgi:hypothetical protein
MQVSRTTFYGAVIDIDIIRYVANWNLVLCNWAKRTSEGMQVVVTRL